MSDKLYIDFETYSDVDIKSRGAHRYAHDSSTEVIYLGYAFNDEFVDIWDQTKPFPEKILEHVRSLGTVVAHNALFEYRIWNHVLARHIPDLPLLVWAQIEDTSAKCGIYQIPLSLDKAAKALGILEKLDTGTRLIKKLCMPNKRGLRIPFNQANADFISLATYCKRDVEVTREIDKALPPIKNPDVNSRELSIYSLTQLINLVGLPFDYENACVIKQAVEEYAVAQAKKLPKITDGKVTTINQHAKIRQFCIANGVSIPNTQAKTIQAYLKKPDLPIKIRELLELRAEIGSSAIAKYKKGIALANYNANYKFCFIHDTLQYHGAGTGRWAGRGIQPQNFPRDKVDNPEEVIDAIVSGTYEGNFVQVGKKLIRPMICAPPGFKLIVFDYSSIENRLLHWIADDQGTIDKFAQGLDQYKDMAADKYNVAYEEVTKDQRFMGKVIILGCGYQMGANTFQKTAEIQFGLKLDKKEAKEAVDAYRAKYPKIVKLWAKLTKLLHTAIASPGRVFQYHLIKAMCTTDMKWLAMQLPSGKCIYYREPRIEYKYIPKYESMGKRPTITHMGTNPYSKKWQRLSLIPGRITENAVQGTAREIMAQGMLNVWHNMPEIILVGTVHDECIGMVREEYITQDLFQQFHEQLCDISWAKTCPITGDGYIEKRYKKD